MHYGPLCFPHFEGTTPPEIDFDSFPSAWGTSWIGAKDATSFQGELDPEPGVIQTARLMLMHAGCYGSKFWQRCTDIAKRPRRPGPASAAVTAPDEVDKSMMAKSATLSPLYRTFKSVGSRLKEYLAGTAGSPGQS
jgi:hypothetical protein